MFSVTIKSADAYSTVTLSVKIVNTITATKVISYDIHLFFINITILSIFERNYTSITHHCTSVHII